MPKIAKVKKTKKTNLPVVKTTKKTKPVKPSPVDYYHCLLTKAQQDWYDPQTGKKRQITACCQDCKTKAPKLNQQRNQEIKKLIVSYQQVGDSLRKLLQPLK